MDFTDRVSAYPNRYMLTDESGRTSYVILERADEPVVVGTALNAENMNKLLQKDGDIMNGPLSMGGHSLSGLPDPVNETDAVPKAYVDIVKNSVFVDSSEADLDNYRTPGFYYFKTAPANIPVGVNGWLLVMNGGGGANVVKQLWWRYGTANTNDYHSYVRTYYSSTGWSEWTQIITAKGGVMTGTLTTKGIKLTEGTDYGASLPSSGTKGQLFFLKV